jgi:biotin transport system substrate-specific component
MKVAVAVGKRSWVSEIGLIGVFTCAMILASVVRIPLPFTPVPFTLQTAVLFLSILVMKRTAGIVQAFYILFSGAHMGIAYLVGPTGGYLLGFLLVALIVPHLLPREQSFGKIFLLFLFSNLVLIYGAGMAWLIFVQHFSPSVAFFTGALPFVVGDTIKIALASSYTLRK